LLKGRGFEPSSSSGKDGAHMKNEWFEAITPEVMADLFEDLLAEASEEENISILFNMLQKCLGVAAHGCETGQGALQKHGVVGAVAILCFLREHLRRDSGAHANGVLRRFFNAAHRKLLVAHRDNQAVLLQELRASIAKLLRKPYSRMFFLNCINETSMSSVELKSLILSDEVRCAIFRLDPSEQMFAGVGEWPGL
jgi:flagellin-specific chaperone FliS